MKLPQSKTTVSSPKANAYSDKKITDSSIQRRENKTGMPDTLKSGIENLSGMDMGDVKVHYNSSKPAGLQAHAYAQGRDIHLAPGQERHLPHEAWHVVQQKQGRVKPTVQLKGKVDINDDHGLEMEADLMGQKSLLSDPNGYPGILQKKSFAQTVAQLTARESVPATPKFEVNANGAKAGAPEIQNKKNAINRLYGGVPSSFPVGWKDVLSKAKKVKGSWVRFHLINNELGGPGDTTNLVPTTCAINTGGAWRGFENDVKTHWDNNKWIWCKTSVTYDATYDDGFPKNIVGEAQWYDDSDNAWKDTAKNGTTLAISKPDFGSGIKTRTLDEMTAVTWSLVTGQGQGTELVKYLNSLSSAYTDIDDFNEALFEENAPTLGDSILNKIDAAIKGTHPDVYIAVDY